MKSISYKAFAYRQGTSSEAPIIVSFVAPAEEVVDWAGMPRRSADAEMAGFQRSVDQTRADRAKEFFQIPKNQSPTAIVVGVHPTQGSAAASLVFHDPETQAVRACTLTLQYPEKGDDVIPHVRSLIEQRLSTSSDGGGNVENGDVGEDEPLPESDVSEQEAESGGELELGRSLLVRLAQRLEEPEWCAANADALLDLAKPATVLDGQHRLKGADSLERGIPFTVCALFNCSWAEQVFQFTVINYTQHGIPDQFITNNAALSLTQAELNELQGRLVQAGVKVVEYELMKVVHFHNESPFKDLVNLTERKDPHKIGYKTMVRLARGWYDGTHPVFRQILPSLYPDLPHKKQHKDRVARWRQEDWGTFFLDFWRVVHEAYASHKSDRPGHKLWDVGHSQLIVAIVLFELQSAFLDALNQQDEEYFKVPGSDLESVRREMRERIQKRAKKFVEWFEPAFFGTPWAHSSLSIGPGRKALAECFYQLVRTKGSFRYLNSSLFLATSVD